MCDVNILKHTGKALCRVCVRSDGPEIPIDYSKSKNATTTSRITTPVSTPSLTSPRVEINSRIGSPALPPIADFKIPFNSLDLDVQRISEKFHEILKYQGEQGHRRNPHFICKEDTFKYFTNMRVAAELKVKEAAGGIPKEHLETITMFNKEINIKVWNPDPTWNADPDNRRKSIIVVDEPSLQNHWFNSELYAFKWVVGAIQEKTKMAVMSGSLIMEVTMHACF